MFKVEGHSNLRKKDGAVVNTDYSSFLAAKERKRDKQKITDLEERLNKLEELITRLTDK